MIWRGFSGGGPGHLDIFGDQAFEHGEEVVDGVGEVDDDALFFLGTGEGEEAFDEIDAAFGGFLDFGDMFGVGGVWGHVAGHGVGIAQDDGEEVVKVVGDAGGETADGFEALGPADLLFVFPAVGDVVDHDQPLDGGIDQALADADDAPEIAAIGGDKLDVLGGGIFGGIVEKGFPGREGGGMNELFDGLPLEFVGGFVKHPGHFGVDVGGEEIGVQDPDAFAGGLKDAAHPVATPLHDLGEG